MKCPHRKRGNACRIAREGVSPDTRHTPARYLGKLINKSHPTSNHHQQKSQQTAPSAGSCHPSKPTSTLPALSRTKPSGKSTPRSGLTICHKLSRNPSLADKSRLNTIAPEARREETNGADIRRPNIGTAVLLTRPIADTMRFALSASLTERCVNSAPRRTRSQCTAGSTGLYEYRS